jgi:hypothetical protein
VKGPKIETENETGMDSSRLTCAEFVELRGLSSADALPRSEAPAGERRGGVWDSASLSV